MKGMPCLAREKKKVVVLGHLQKWFITFIGNVFNIILGEGLLCHSEKISLECLFRLFDVLTEGRATQVSPGLQGCCPWGDFPTQQAGVSADHLTSVTASSLHGLWLLSLSLSTVHVLQGLIWFLQDTQHGEGQYRFCTSGSIWVSPGNRTSLQHIA